LLDGRIEKLGNYTMEPPGLFRGRGEHPKTGKLKTVSNTALLKDFNCFAVARQSLDKRSVIVWRSLDNCPAIAR
jgi:hypothetical protein